MRNYQIKFKIKKYSNFSINYAVGFEQFVDGSTTTYYLIDSHNCKIVLFDQYWQFISYVVVNDTLNYLVIAENQLFLSAENGIYKINRNGEIVKASPKSGAIYKGIYFNSTNSLLYVGTYSSNKIQVFNQNLTFLRTIRTGSYIPYSLNAYGDTLFAGTTTGEILLFKNELIQKVFNNTCSTKTLITSIAIDKYGFMAVTCFFDSLIHLYHVNGSYMNIEIHTAYHPENIAIDSNGRLIINSISEFDIYY